MGLLDKESYMLELRKWAYGVTMPWMVIFYFPYLLSYAIVKETRQHTRDISFTILRRPFIKWGGVVELLHDWVHMVPF